MAATQRERAKLFKLVERDVHEDLLEVLTKLMSRPKAKEFKKPVTLPAYLDVIKQPMDLGTVHSKLMADLRLPYEEKNYQYAEEFAHDVRLTFKNCFLFNPVDHHVFKDGRLLLGAFEDAYLNVVKKWESSARAPCVPLRTRCQLLLTDVRRNPLSEWFRRDDWKALGDYVDRLRSKTPMDLDEVQRRFDSGRYGAAGAVAFDGEAFRADLNLIWENGIDYNGEHSAFGIILQELRKLVKNRFELIDTLEARRLEKIQSREAVRQQQQEPTQDATHATSYHDPEVRKRLRELHSACSALKPASAAKMAKTIEEVCPAAVQWRPKPPAQPKDGRVDLDKVSDARLRELLEEAQALGAKGEK